MTRSIVHAAMLAALTAAPAVAGPAPARYAVAMTLTDGGTIVGQPHLTVVAGESSRIVIAAEPTGPGYDLTLTARPDPRGIAVSSTIKLTHAGGAVSDYAPALLVQPGQLATFEVGNAGATFRAELRVDPIPG